MEATPIPTSFLALPETQKFFVAIGVGLFLIVGLGGLLSKLTSKEGREQYLVPSVRPSLIGLADWIFEKFLTFHDSLLGVEGRKHAGFTASIFFTILFCNIIGLVPGMPAATTTVWVNVGISLAVFIYFNLQGIKAHGLISYIKHFGGPSSLPIFIYIPIFFLLFPLEILSTCLRIVTLNMRLYWNITADHEVLHSVTGIFGTLGFPMYILGLFVCIVQAFVFTVLTMIYIQLASAHEEGDEHH